MRLVILTLDFIKRGNTLWNTRLLLLICMAFIYRTMICIAASKTAKGKVNVPNAMGCEQWET